MRLTLDTLSTDGTSRSYRRRIQLSVVIGSGVLLRGRSRSASTSRRRCRTSDHGRCGSYARREAGRLLTSAPRSGGFLRVFRLPPGLTRSVDRPRCVR